MDNDIKKYPPQQEAAILAAKSQVTLKQIVLEFGIMEKTEASDITLALLADFVHTLEAFGRLKKDMLPTTFFLNELGVKTLPEPNAFLSNVVAWLDAHNSEDDFYIGMLDLLPLISKMFMGEVGYSADVVLSKDTYFQALDAWVDMQREFFSELAAKAVQPDGITAIDGGELLNFLQSQELLLHKAQPEEIEHLLSDFRDVLNEMIRIMHGINRELKFLPNDIRDKLYAALVKLKPQADALVTSHLDFDGLVKMLHLDTYPTQIEAITIIQAVLLTYVTTNNAEAFVTASLTLISVLCEVISLQPIILP